MAVRTPRLERSVLKIRRLNDAFRTSLQGGRVLLTSGVAALTVAEQTEVLKAVITFDNFTPDNDPHGEHDFGNFDLFGYRFFWKIDCMDLNYEYGSENPADPDQTARLMTIMLASEY